MKNEFAELPHIPLQPGTLFEHPPTNPELVHLDSPVIEVMTDFRYVKPITVTPNAPIDEALDKMKIYGVRLLLVTDEAGQIAGLITARDIQGEAPIQVVNDERVPRSNITVARIMSRPAAIAVLDMISVRGAEVGHIIEILNHLQRQHILVVETDEHSGNQRVRGLFSLTQISKQLPDELQERYPSTHTLAQIVRDVT